MRSMILPMSAALLLAACGGKPAEETAAAPAAPAIETAEQSADAPPVENVSTPPLDAAGAPRFREGLWEVTQTDEDGETETSRECFGAELREDMARIFGPPPAGCTKSGGPGLGGINLTFNCDQSGVKSETKLQLNGSDTAFKMKLGIYLVEGAKRSGGEITGTGKWIGACPAGMKPGDTEGQTEN